jgi:hypothetical protein
MRERRSELFMAKKRNEPLPKSLNFLQGFVNFLAKLPPEDLNEDVDGSRLESALRKRLRGLDVDAAEARLADDRAKLEKWLKSRPNHPAHWVFGFMLLDDLATHLTQPPRPRPAGPKMTFEPPTGWKVKEVPFRLDLKAGKVIGSIMAIDEGTFELLTWQREQAAQSLRRDGRSTVAISDVTYGACGGKKYLNQQTDPVRWKQVDYVLKVPGGYVNIGLGTLTGADFDETALESKLHTLRIGSR